MEARVKLAVPAIPKGSVVEVSWIGEDGRPGDVLTRLGNGDSFVLPLDKEGCELVLRIRGA